MCITFPLVHLNFRTFPASMGNSSVLGFKKSRDAKSESNASFVHPSAEKTVIKEMLLVK